MKEIYRKIRRLKYSNFRLYDFIEKTYDEDIMNKMYADFQEISGIIQSIEDFFLEILGDKNIYV